MVYILVHVELTNVGLTSHQLVQGYGPTKGSVIRGHKASGPGRVFPQ